MILHEIDRPEGKYSDLELDEMMVFCILDTSVPYEKCCQAFDALKKDGLTTRRSLSLSSPDSVRNILKSTGYRWANQKAKYLTEFGRNDIDLRSATREEIVKSIKGVGMKLSSMFLRNTRGADYAVLDVHTLRWLQKNYAFSPEEFKKMSYLTKEEHFARAADFLGMTATQLDVKIWEENRIGNRK